MAIRRLRRWSIDLARQNLTVETGVGLTVCAEIFRIAVAVAVASGLTDVKRLAQYGGQVVSAETSLRPLASALECPLLLVR